MASAITSFSDARAPAPELAVGDVAARSGVAVSTLHFYESKGLIQAARTGGNQRRYPRAILRRVAFIKVAQRVGIPLAEIAEALAGAARRAHADSRRLAAAVTRMACRDSTSASAR